MASPSASTLDRASNTSGSPTLQIQTTSAKDLTLPLRRASNDLPSSKVPKQKPRRRLKIARAGRDRLISSRTRELVNRELLQQTSASGENSTTSTSASVESTSTTATADTVVPSLTIQDTLPLSTVAETNDDSSEKQKDELIARRLQLTVDLPAPTPAISVAANPRLPAPNPKTPPLQSWSFNSWGSFSPLDKSSEHQASTLHSSTVESPAFHFFALDSSASKPFEIHSSRHQSSTPQPSAIHSARELSFLQSPGFCSSAPGSLALGSPGLDLSSLRLSPLQSSDLYLTGHQSWTSRSPAIQSTLESSILQSPTFYSSALKSPALDATGIDLSPDPLPSPLQTAGLNPVGHQSSTPRSSAVKSGLEASSLQSPALHSSAVDSSARHSSPAKQSPGHQSSTSQSSGIHTSGLETYSPLPSAFTSALEPLALGSPGLDLSSLRLSPLQSSDLYLTGHQSSTFQSSGIHTSGLETYTPLPSAFTSALEPLALGSPGLDLSALRLQSPGLHSSDHQPSAPQSLAFRSSVPESSSLHSSASHVSAHPPAFDLSALRPIHLHTSRLHSSGHQSSASHPSTIHSSALNLSTVQQSASHSPAFVSPALISPALGSPTPQAPEHNLDMSTQDEREARNRNLRDRMPMVQQASRRLQSALEIFDSDPWPTPIVPLQAHRDLVESNTSRLRDCMGMFETLAVDMARKTEDLEFLDHRALDFSEEEHTKATSKDSRAVLGAASGDATPKGGQPEAALAQYIMSSPQRAIPDPPSMPGTFTNAICHQKELLMVPVLALTMMDMTPSMHAPTVQRCVLLSHLEVGLDGVEALCQGCATIDESEYWRENVREPRIGRLGIGKAGSGGYSESLKQEQLQKGMGRGNWLWFGIKFQQSGEEKKKGKGGKWACFGVPIEALQGEVKEKGTAKCGGGVDGDGIEVPMHDVNVTRMTFRLSIGGIACMDLWEGAEHWRDGAWEGIKKAMAQNGLLVRIVIPGDEMMEPALTRAKKEGMEAQEVEVEGKGKGRA
ncbi:hypothetical protein MMC07_004890 [Pseudocyphellaria aurata]|nr:hypothetical protein [Pseudocyphellaria aurata]